MVSKAIIFLKAHVETFTKKDGVVVHAHETKASARDPKDLGAGCWQKGHHVKLSAPGHPLHGMHGEVTGKGHADGFANVKCTDGRERSCNGADLRPADTHSWPDEKGAQEKKPVHPRTEGPLDPHPHVIGKAKPEADGARFSFHGKTYEKTGKEGNSMHDQTPVSEYQHAESGHRLWKDDQDRVHADDKGEAARWRGEK